MSHPTPDDPTPFDNGDDYDILLGGLDFGLDFYRNLAREAKGPILDLTCGTGRVMLPLLQEGLDVDGVDLFEGMLTRLKTKAKALGLEPRVYQSNMASFSINRQYALIIIPFNAFVHNLTTDTQVACLECCRDHLLSGGLLAFDTYFPGAGIITAPQGIRVLEMEMTHPETGLPIRCWDTRHFDRVRQLQYSRMDLEFLDAEGNVVDVRPTQTTVRWIYKAEMALLLRVAGFDRWEISGDFEGRPLDKETDAMIVKAWTRS